MENDLSWRVDWKMASIQQHERLESLSFWNSRPYEFRDTTALQNK